MDVLRSGLRARWPVVAALVWVWSGLLSGISAERLLAAERGRDQPASEDLAQLQAQLPDVQSISRAFKLVAKIARPGVVHIRVSGGERGAMSEDEIEEYLRERLKDRPNEEQSDPNDPESGKKREDLREQMRRWLQRMQPPPGAGSGIILDTAGHILTNNHVVAGRNDITVILHDEREFPAKVVGTDPKTDLAVVKIDAPDLHPLKLGNSDEMEVGDWVIAVGSPFGLQHTVTHGIVSAVGRADIMGVGIDYQNFIQTDAAINPGNSGGPLLNLRGEVVGVNTAIATHGDGVNAGIAFAIPSNMALRVAEQLKTNGSVTRGYLGIVPLAVEKTDVEIFGLPSAGGILVGDVVRKSPADHAGLQVDDVVVSINEVEIAGREQFRRLVADLRPDERVRLRVIRDGRETPLTVRIGVQPEDLRRTAAVSTQLGRAIARLGLRVRTLRVGMLPAFDEHARGVVVVERDEESKNAPDVTPRELVVGCNEYPVKTVHDLEEALTHLSKSHEIVLKIQEPTGDMKLVRIKPRSRR